MQSELDGLLDDPYVVTERRLLESLFHGHAYAVHPFGPDKGFSFRRADVATFRQRTWRPEGATLVACGRCGPDDVQRWVARAVRDWRGAGPPPPRSPRERPAALLAVEMPGKTQSDIALGRRVPTAADERYPLLRIADSVLGHIVLMGRLGASLRTKHALAYYASSRIELMRAAAYWSIHAGVNPRHVRRARREVLRVLERLANDGATSTELALAKAGIIAGVAARAQSSAGVADMLGALAVQDLPVTYLGEFIARVRGARRGEVHRAARDYLDPRGFSVVTAGPAV